MLSALVNMLFVFRYFRRIATRVKRVVDTFVCIIHMSSNRPLTTTTNEQMLVRRLEDSYENMHSLSCLGTYSIYIPSSNKHYYYLGAQNSA